MRQTLLLSAQNARKVAKTVNACVNDISNWPDYCSQFDAVEITQGVE